MSDPELGRALLVEVHPAGGRPLERRQLALERAGAILDRGARGRRRRAPAICAGGDRGGIHAVLHTRLAAGGRGDFSGSAAS